MTRLQIILSELSDLNLDDLLLINEACVDNIKERRRTASLKAKRLFSVGDTVGFGDPSSRGNRSYKVGQLTAIKRTKARVVVGATTWTVPLNMLQAV